MLNFRTTIPIQPVGGIDYEKRLMLFGSCFATTIGAKLAQAKFNSLANPFGVLYNPLSIKKAVLRLLEPNAYTTKDLFEYQSLWHSFDHHSSFSDTSPETTLTNINSRLKSSSEFLQETDYLLITFGTAWIYRLNANNQIVSNCHKLPDKTFVRERLSVEDIVKEYTSLIALLKEKNPNLKIVFTLSPVRHWKDGAHENAISKATLLLAIEKLMCVHKNTYYFPAYEIMIDELRDYRFYADDMLHPSTMAINYIWQHFSDTFFSAGTKQLLLQIEKIQEAVNHRPFNSNSEEYKNFCRQQLEKILLFEKSYPKIDFREEKEKLKFLNIFTN